MIRQRAGRYVACAGAILAGAVLGPAAYASDHHNGNGHHNRNTISYRSPTHNRGYQHTSNSNAGGMNPVQNALCRHSYICHVTQNITIVRPEKPEPPAAEPVVDEPVAPEPAAPPVEIVERAPAPAANPLLYFGPNGIMLGGPHTMVFPFSFGMFG